MRIIDIIWLPQIVDKLAWKHRVLPEEVDDVLFGKPSFERCKKDTFLVRMCTQHWDKQKAAGIWQYSLSTNRHAKR